MSKVDEEIKLEYYKNLINSSNNASARSRTTYFILCLTCFFILVGVFNMELSWERHINFEERSHLGFKRHFFPDDTSAQMILENKIAYKNADEKSKLTYDKYVENMSNNYIGEFFKRYEVNIPILGIRIFSSDLSVVSAMGIMILMTWLFYSIRRENHIINKVRDEFSDDFNHAYLKRFVFYGSVFENVFLTATSNHIVNLKEGKKNKIQRIFYNSVSPIVIVMWFLRILPMLTIGSTLCSDIIPLFHYPEIFEKYAGEIIIRELFTFTVLLYCFFITIKLHDLDRNISDHLAYMNSHL